MSITLTKILLVFVFGMLMVMIILSENFSENIKAKPWLLAVNNLLVQFSVNSPERSLYSMHSLSPDRALFQTYERLLQINGNLETTVNCVGSPDNQSCLFKNLYYTERTFWIFTTKKASYPSATVRTGAWVAAKLTPNRRRFYTYTDLEEFVRRKVNPVVIPNLTLYFDLPWLSNIGHALFDGLYPAYLALVRFPPRHLRPFRIALSCYDANANSHFSQEVLDRFAGLGVLNATILENLSEGRWFAFEEWVMGSGHLCQRCLQPNLQLPGGVELNGSRLFRERMYKQYGLGDPVTRPDRYRALTAYVIDNKRFSSADRKEINLAIEEINRYTDLHQFQLAGTQTKVQWPLVRVSYIRYPLVVIEKDGSLLLNATEIQSRLLNNSSKMMAHLRLIKDTTIHITGPGTGQMYQTFLPDGSVNINLGGLGRVKRNNTVKSYTSFMEQYMTSGTPYIKGLYYPINQRPEGIKKEILIQLIKEAAQLITDGFSIPVNPQENLAADGQLFVEMCESDKAFCQTVTDRWGENHMWCIDTWPEEIIHEVGPWAEEGISIDNTTNITCSYNRTLMHQLRKKYNLHFASHSL